MEAEATESSLRRSSRQSRPSSRYGQEFEAFRRSARPTSQFQRQQQQQPQQQPQQPFNIPRNQTRREISTSRRLDPGAPTIAVSSRFVPAIDRAEQLAELNERGQTRSGVRFAARNLPHFSTLRELLAHHQRLLVIGPVVSTRYAKVGKGTVLQTCIRFRSDHPDIRGALNRVLAELFREIDSQREGFEVTITFNAILSNRDSTSFSLFYGQDYGEQSQGGSHSRLGFSGPVRVRNLLHLRRVQTEFDLEDLIRRYSLAFDSSDVVVVKLINVVYLIHQYQDD